MKSEPTRAGGAPDAPESAAHRDSEDVMIIGLLTLLTREICNRVTAALVARGFPDVRASYLPVFQRLSPEGSRLTGLAELVMAPKQTVGETVDALERLGYVERAPDPSDGRATLIRRTARGQEVNVIAAAVARETQRAWAARLGEERMAQALATLRDIAQILRKPD
ncbi:MAG TPA: MarR family winged helix-turn-helix transcriptional regulator [Ktedonobacterales bacterium]